MVTAQRTESHHEEALAQQSTDQLATPGGDEAGGERETFADHLAAALARRDEEEATAEKQDVAEERDHEHVSGETLPALRADQAEKTYPDEEQTPPGQLTEAQGSQDNSGEAESFANTQEDEH
jgi:hypothetical protein